MKWVDKNIRANYYKEKNTYLLLIQLWIRFSLFKTSMLCKFCVIWKLLYLYLCWFFWSERDFKNYHVNSSGKACQRHHLDSPLLVGVLEEMFRRLIEDLAFFAILEIGAISSNVSVTNILLMPAKLLWLSCGFQADFRNNPLDSGNFLLLGPLLLMHLLLSLHFLKFSLILFHVDFATVNKNNNKNKWKWIYVIVVSLWMDLFHRQYSIE